MTEYIYCKGCKTVISGCLYKDYNSDGNCPCVTCIIKSMCRTGCPDYDVYRGLGHNVKGEIKTND